MKTNFKSMITLLPLLMFTFLFQGCATGLKSNENKREYLRQHLDDRMQYRQNFNTW